ncbi:MAG: magnesium transporter [Alphaproteobacteria bacterium]
MTEQATNALAAIERKYFTDLPAETARMVEASDPDVAAPVLSGMDAQSLVPVWERLVPPLAAALFARLPEETASGLLELMAPNRSVAMVLAMEPAEREQCLTRVASGTAKELRRLMTYPEDSAGRIMDSRIPYFRELTTVKQAIDQLRTQRSKTASSLFLVDDEGVLTGRVAIQDLAVSDPDNRLKDLRQPLIAVVDAFASHDEVADTLERLKLFDLPVTDIDGRLMGIVYHAALVETLQESNMASMQTMVGASKNERALSPPSFAVRKRLPWLVINLGTAFLAASVVGLFEDTIAAFTALAVLLPVVAGQSGNSGSQALAVTMRGLALREISIGNWLRVSIKETSAGLVNGIAIAAICGLGVYLWSGSVGLVIVICAAMVLAMIAAGLAGALVPIVLTRVGQDPAVASSIILTTVTDIAGFMAFLGIATLMSGML